MRFGLLLAPSARAPGAARDALGQVQLADRLGFADVWVAGRDAVVFLAACSQWTERITLGVADLPPGGDRAGLAASVTTLSELGGGRVEVACGGRAPIRRLHAVVTTATAAEATAAEATAAEAATAEATTAEATAAEATAARGSVQVPALWIIGSSGRAIDAAARHGVGALCLDAAGSPAASGRVRAYEAALAGDRSVSLGPVVNPLVAALLPASALEDLPRPGGLVADRCRGFERAGVGLLLLDLRSASHGHARMCGRLERFAAEVMPEFERRAAATDAARATRLDGAIAAALARRDRSGPTGVLVPGGSAAVVRRDAVAERLGAVRVQVRRRGRSALSTFVRRADDRRLERTVAADPVLALVFGVMARRFDPQAARGFVGEIQWTVRGRRTTSWVLVIDGRRARVRPGRADSPAVVVIVARADMARIVVGELHPARALITGRMTLRGDLAVAARLGAMFGARRGVV